MSRLEEAIKRLEAKIGDQTNTEIEAKNGKKFRLEAKNGAGFSLIELDGIVEIRRVTAAPLKDVAQWLLDYLAPSGAKTSEPTAEKKLTNLYQAFTSAMLVIKHPKLRIDEYTFSPAKPGSANPGAVYVKAGDGTYLGKYIAAGKFVPTRDASDQDVERIEEIAKDPLAHAKIHGQRYGKCSVCNRDLTDPESIEAGIGPICASNFGF